MLEKVEQWLAQIDQQQNNHLLREACNHLLREACLFAEQLSDLALKEDLVEKGLAISHRLRIAIPPL
ncbi:hypothetical protein [Coxiella-like endosymbiont]|uniref:hypothetical protein n=1 Tax=Coxiella-like endosymbiont TaxID=1592897 RepID=UPI00272967FD|nr:hypothetical protein [Coxiella-like endosymbiont]